MQGIGTALATRRPEPGGRRQVLVGSPTASGLTGCPGLRLREQRAALWQRHGARETATDHQRTPIPDNCFY